MGAFEIGEPRFDSGMMSENPPAEFRPLMPLFPQEVCWIMDRIFACEMEWHVGYTLSQTIFSCHYVHNLHYIDPEFVDPAAITIDLSHSSDAPTPRFDESHPPELVTRVLLGSVMALLKCCDLVWRELSKDNIIDTEDWQSEKCDVSMKEGYPVRHILNLLDAGIYWVETYQTSDPTWGDAREALLSRLRFRKLPQLLLQIFDTLLSKSYFSLEPLIASARAELRILRKTHTEPSPESPARTAFDPQLARSLNSFIPLHVIEISTQNATWDKMEAWLEGLSEMGLLASTEDISTWEIVGHLQTWVPDPNRLRPYVRSATISAFSDGVLRIDRDPHKYLLEEWLYERLDTSLGTFQEALSTRWRAAGQPLMSDLQEPLRQLLAAHIKGSWYNGPRRRRHYMKSLVHWHELCVTLQHVSSCIEPVQGADVVVQVSRLALSYRLSIIREIIFSGFQLELYNAEERVFAYWYAVQVIGANLEVWHAMLVGLGEGKQDTKAAQELKWQIGFFRAVQALSSAIFAVTLKQLKSPWERLQLNCARRYKWASVDEYDDSDIAPTGHPDFWGFTRACQAIIQDEAFSPAACVADAKQMTTELSNGRCGGWAGRWCSDRLQFTRRLIDVCDGLSGLPENMKEAASFDPSYLKWDLAVHPWFPKLVQPSS
ncbi:Mak10-domain-containing protein [Coniophora puteana RWD-64-598 SS2]|uniref:Mak10-domain-containing protein n=1 Tax=Coniophora puteana (strain RWD-64-598) TaxID=741705 RepID=A0A5M3N401_CONPW|nr:Mak10-domain-containing protein [Coniophora puteana RWD-64-598 SS2]EIW85641.1 Mak10-domain-containing protein [Coniophora puteana RWD-64-598 SS2]